MRPTQNPPSPTTAVRLPKTVPQLFDAHNRPVISASSIFGASSSSRAYEGAGWGRRLTTWGTWGGGPNAVLSGSLNTLRSRSRELVRNNNHASVAVESLVTNLVGTGITPLWVMPESMSQIKEEWQLLWDDSQTELDYSGFNDFYGMQALAARTMVQSGELLARIVPLRSTSSNLVPLKIQLIEPDYLDENYNRKLENGNTIRMGIEFDRLGRRVAYHLYKDHPGDSFAGGYGLERVRVPVSRMIHVGKPDRPGQVRFPPWLAPAIVRLHELDQYQDAEVVRKKTAAMFGGFIKESGSDIPGWQYMGPEDATAESGAAQSCGPQMAETIVALEPGTFPILPPGMDVTFSEPADVGTNYDVFLKYELRGIARVMGITYEQLTGDLSDVNYSSIRAGLLEFRRFCRQIINHIIVFQFCRPVVRAWMNAAVLVGIAPVTSSEYINNPRLYTRVRWHYDGWEFVDPVKDVTAMKLAVRNGFMSRSEVISMLTGSDPSQVDREIAQDNRRAAGLSVLTDSNPADDVQRDFIQASEQI